jgi:hypothetical protein
VTTDGSPDGTDDDDGPPSPRRRRFLAAAGGTAAVAATASLAGCSGVADFVANQLLEDVNVFNETGRPVAGSVEVVDPNGDTVLDDTFDLASGDTGSDSNDGGDGGGSDGEEADTGSTATFADVWTDPGSYEVALAFDGVEVGGDATAADTVDVADTDEEMLGVGLGIGGDDGGVAFRVGESLSELADE